MSDFSEKSGKIGSGSFRAVVRFLSEAQNAARLCEARPVARQLVLYLARVGGCSDLSEMALARLLARAPSAVAANLAWLEREGALDVERRSSGGLRQASLRRLNLRGCLALFGRVLGGVARAVASVRRCVRARGIVRSFRARPGERVNTPVTVAEPFKKGSFLSSAPEVDASQLLARHGRGEIYLEPARLRAVVAEVAREYPESTAAEVASWFRVTL